MQQTNVSLKDQFKDRDSGAGKTSAPFSQPTPNDVDQPYGLPSSG